MAKPVPEGYHAVTPSLTFKDSQKAAVFKQAVAAGGTVVMPVAEMFWGDRAGSIKDPFGYSWMVATHTRDLSDDEIRKGAEAFFAQMAKK